MRVCHLLAFCLISLVGGQLFAADRFDAVAFVKELREPAKLDIATRALEKVPNSSAIHFMDFSLDVKTFCAVHTNGVVANWDVDTGKLKSTKRVSARKLRAVVGTEADMFVEIYALSQDHSRLGLALRSGDVVFWDVEKEAVISRLDTELKGKCSDLALSSTGKYALIGGGQARGAVVIDVDTGKKAFVHDAARSDITHVAISPNDKWAIYAEKDSAVHMYPLLGGEGSSHTFERPRQIGHFKANNVGAIFITNFNELHQGTTKGMDTFGMRVGIPACVVLAANPHYYIIYDKDGQVEIRSLESPWVCWHGSFADERPVMFAIGSDGRTLAVQTKNGPQLKVFSAVPEHPAARARRILLGLHAAANYDALTAIARQLHKEEASPFAWNPLDAPFDILFDHLPTDPEAEARFEKWISEDDDALLPKLLLAQRYIQRAWASRGGGFAASVTEGGWKGFHEYIGKARDLIVPVCEKPNAPAPARRILLTVAMAESWNDDRWASQAEWMLKHAPQYRRGHQQVIQMLLPRWGGKPGDSAHYAARLADFVGGDDGDALYAQVWLMNYDLHGKAKDFVTEVAMDYERVKRGLLHLSDKSANPTYYAHRGLQVSLHERDLPAAQAFLAKLKDPTNSWDVNWWRNPQELAFALRFAVGAAP